jgi:hypothetical protein
VKLEFKKYRIQDVMKSDTVIIIVAVTVAPNKAKPADRQLVFQSPSVVVTLKEEFNRAYT